jgi:hypothetical protein
VAGSHCPGSFHGRSGHRLVTRPSTHLTTRFTAFRMFGIRTLLGLELLTLIAAQECPRVQPSPCPTDTACAAIGGPGATCRLGLTLTDRGHVDGKRRVGVRGRAHGLADGLGRLRHATSTTREVDCACGGVSRNVGLL